MPAKTDLSAFNCSLARALSAVGDWWTFLIVRDAFMGSTRFGEFQASLGIARNILAARLEALVEAGVLARGGSAARPHYGLTKKGEDLLPALVALMQWGDKWQSDAPPVTITDAKGRVLEPVRVKSRGGDIVTAGDVGFRPGPGADERTRDFLHMQAAKRQGG